MEAGFAGLAEVGQRFENAPGLERMKRAKKPPRTIRP
jgi:hypothetical protein